MACMLRKDGIGSRGIVCFEILIYCGHRSTSAKCDGKIYNNFYRKCFECFVSINYFDDVTDGGGFSMDA